VVEWFEARGVGLKTEKDGRIFPVTDSAQTVVACLLRAAQQAAVELRPNTGVVGVARLASGDLELALAREVPLACTRLLLATGGCRAPAAGQLAVSLGHTLEPPVPSLFTFNVPAPWLRELAGVAVEPVEVSVAGTALRERGPLLITHWGVSGPAILRLSAWGARALQQMDYQFTLQLNWLPGLTGEALAIAFQQQRKQQGGRFVVNSPLGGLPVRLWKQLVTAAGVPEQVRWAGLSREAQQRLLPQLTRLELPVSGKSLNKDEFVTCGGVRLGEVNCKTMASRICPGLYFAGELLDIDGLTGGYNFQAAWTTGWIAGQAIAASLAS
jgi:predicted Rossmann fold flavoprotein